MNLWLSHHGEEIDPESMGARIVVDKSQAAGKFLMECVRRLLLSMPASVHEDYPHSVHNVVFLPRALELHHPRHPAGHHIR